MSRGQYPLLLMLAMGLPTASRAIGLGDIRVDSALNEPLSAQIDIIGANRDELISLTAKVAGSEIFQRYGLDRPAFLSSATFQVGVDAQRRPVLKIHSTKPFTDPLIGFVVDLHWDGGELIREYSLLLDPAGFAPPKAATAAATIGAGPSPAAVQYRVAARDTLRGITRRIDKSSASQTQRMMIAIFRANPHAFEGNINLLHRGALLRIPSAEEAAAIGAADARREVRAQMAAWRLKGRPEASRKLAANRTAAKTVEANPIATAAPDAATAAALQARVQSLEQALGEVRKQVVSETTKIDDLKQLMERPAAARPQPADTPSPTLPTSNATLLGGLGAGLALLLAGFAFVRRRLAPARPQPRVALVAPAAAAAPEPVTAPPVATRAEAARVAVTAKKTPSAAPQAPEVREIPDPAVDDHSHDYTAVDIEALEKSYLVTEMAAFTEAQQRAIEDTAILETDSSADSANDTAVESAATDQEPRDRTATVQHMQMPSHLEDRSVIVERRKNVSDVLKSETRRSHGRR